MSLIILTILAIVVSIAMTVSSLANFPRGVIVSSFASILLWTAIVVFAIYYVAPLTVFVGALNLVMASLILAKLFEI